MDKSYNFYNISKHRTELMGLATIFIIIFHSSINVKDITILQSLKNIGDFGVDIFLFLSGIGLYFSYTNDGDKVKFYKNRFIRIMPYYIPIAIVWYISYHIIFGGNIQKIIIDIITLGFWTRGNMCMWYISAISILYLISPYYIDLMKKKPISITIVSVLSMIILTFIIRFTRLNDICGYLLIFLARVPIFIIGLNIGRLVYEHIEIEKNKLYKIHLLAIFCLLTSIIIVNPSYFYIPFFIKYLMYIPIAISVCIIVSNTLTNNNRILETFGIYSLLVYLFHEKILWIISYIAKEILYERKIILNIVAIILTLIVSYFYDKIIKNYILQNKKN